MTSRRCVKVKRDGERCRAWAVTGTTVCIKHGGAAPQVRQAAQVRAASMEAHQAAARMVARAGVDADPLEHLLESLHRSAALVEVWGAMVSDLDSAAAQHARERDLIRGELGYGQAGYDGGGELRVWSNDHLLTLNKFGEAQLHPYVAEYEKALERRAKLAKMCIDAKLDERMVALQQRQVEVAQQAFEAMLAELSLSAPQRQEARLSYVRHLRAVA